MDFFWLCSSNDNVLAKWLQRVGLLRDNEIPCNKEGCGKTAKWTKREGRSFGSVYRCPNRHEVAVTNWTFFEVKYIEKYL